MGRNYTPLCESNWEDPLLQRANDYYPGFENLADTAAEEMAATGKDATFAGS